MSHLQGLFEPTPLVIHLPQNDVVDDPADHAFSPYLAPSTGITKLEYCQQIAAWWIARSGNQPPELRRLHPLHT